VALPFKVASSSQFKQGGIIHVKKFNNQFPRNISIRITFVIKRWYLKLEFMKSIIIVAYLTSSMATPATAIMLYRMMSIMVIQF
jgi:hypothetical protein